MKYKCPRCGWSENEYRDQHCSCCGSQLPPIQRIDRTNPFGLDDRLNELKRDIWSWIVDVGECFHERKIDLAWKTRLIEDLANWFLYAAGKENEKSLFYGEKASKEIEKEIDHSSRRSKKAEHPRESNKKRFQFLSPGIIWAYAAGMWTILLLDRIRELLIQFGMIG